MQPQEIQRGKRLSKRAVDGLGEAQKGSLWLCYAGHWAGRQKSVIVGNRRRPKPSL